MTIQDNLMKTWKNLKSFPGGKWIFSRAVGFMIPYTGSIKPSVKELSPGFSKVEVKDRRSIRNHLKSVHAIALVNMGEFSTGLAFISSLPKNHLCILVKLEAHYLKKARGTLIAESHVDIKNIQIKNNANYEVRSVISDSKGESVAEIIATWRVRDMGEKS